MVKIDPKVVKNLLLFQKIYHFFLLRKKSTTFLSTTFNFRISKMLIFRISIGQSVLNLRDMKQCGAKPPLSLQEKTEEKSHFESVDPQNFPLRGIEYPRFTDTYNIAPLLN